MIQLKRKKKLFHNWNNNSVYYYSIKYLKTNPKKFSFYFLKCFKLYRIISKTNKINSKVQLINLFLKWLKLKNNSQNLRINIRNNKLNYLLKYLIFLLRLLIKYEIVESNWLQTKNESYK
jgi:hypothetical protein